MKNFKLAVRYGVLALSMMAVASVSFARNAKFGPLPPPPVEDSAYLKFGPLPPPPVEDSVYLKFGPLPPPPVEDSNY
ncbi:MAG TPA: hypothetical protein VFQ91_21640 [Bryobacteraceae bacterium]|nr:hypothetical protein [Bryobacteraceae bacterium]